MKTLARILPFLLLTGCEDSDIYRLTQFAVTSVSSTAKKVPREQAAAIPYATMGLELGSTPEILLVLGTQTRDELDWFAGDQVLLRTLHGRVVRTVGLPYDLGGLRQITGSTTASPSEPVPATAQYSFDFPEIGVFDAAAQCTARDAGPAQIEILGSQLTARHIVEHCVVRMMRWNFDNDYWTDPMTGYVWRSSQHVHPDSPPVILEVFRPEQNPA